MKNYRHGDIILQKSKNEPGEKIKHQGSFVLAEGETTGHKHVISVPKLEDMIVTRLSDGSVLLTLKTDGTLTHEEHKTLPIKKGTYKVVREREYDYFSLQTRRVID